MGQGIRLGFATVIAAITLSGCMSDGPKQPFGKNRPDAAVTRAASGTPTTAYEQAQADRSEDNRSATIDALIARRSALPAGSAYDEVARATLAASSRAAESELQQARLRSRAADKNWLPHLGPSISLASMSSFIATLVIDQVLFDNGRKKAERDFARADVEAAAVQFAQDQNDRVGTALTLYLTAEQESDRAAAAVAGLIRMRESERIMKARVEGGISDASELAVIRSKVAELQSRAESATRNATAARAELGAMSARPLDKVHGIAALTLPSDAVKPLSLHLAEVERERDMAQAVIARASFLPGLSAMGAVGTGGTRGPDLTLSSDAGFGFSTPDNLRAVEASKEAADRRVGQAKEDAARQLAALSAERDGQAANARRAAEMATQAQANANLFKRQFEAGTRTVSELSSIIETAARLADEAILAKYRAASVEIELARTLGVLADGSAL